MAGLAVLAGVGAVALVRVLDGIVYASHEWREVQFGAPLLLAVALIKFGVDLYVVYVRRARVQIDEEGVRECARGKDGELYRWDEIIDLRLEPGPLYTTLELVYRTKVLEGDCVVDSAAIMRIRELTLSREERGRVEAFAAERITS